MREGCLLVIEDNSMDVELLREALESVGGAIDLRHAPNGEEGLAYLRRSQGSDVDTPRPRLVFLDINMPLLDGHGVMDAIAADEALRDLPVVVLTTSASPSDIAEMYERRCSGYLLKPTNFDEFESMLDRVFDYWFDTVLPPPASR